MNKIFKKPGGAHAAGAGCELIKKKKLHKLHRLAGLLLLFLALSALPTPAAGSTAAGAPLFIDSRHVYEGMEKNYAEGYVPSVAGGRALVVLPLLSDSVSGPLAVSVNLGDQALSPFVYKNYQKQFAKKSYAFGDETVESYLVQFSLELAKNRVNGCYPVTFAVSGVTDSGEAFAQDFMLYVNICDGIDPHASSPEPEPEPEPEPASQPKLMVVAYQLEQDHLPAGESAALTVTVRNTSGTQQVKNIKLSFTAESGEIWPEGTGAAYCTHIDAGVSYTWKFTVTALPTAQSRPHPATITMEYEDSRGQAYTASDRIILPVRQPVRLEYEESSLPPRVTQGDTVPFSMTLMNMGKSTIFNALLQFEIPGLATGGSLLVGTIPPGESQAGTTNFRVESAAPLGEVSGTLTLSYEDDYGERYEKEIPLATTIEQKVAAPPPSDKEKDDASRFPAWVAWAGGAVLLVTATFLVIRWLKQKKAMEEDEMRL
jgi:hypothetical protein